MNAGIFDTEVHIDIMVISLPDVDTRYCICILESRDSLQSLDHTDNVASPGNPIVQQSIKILPKRAQVWKLHFVVYV